MRSIENAPGHDRGHPQHAGALAAATAFALGDGSSVQTPNIFAPTSTPAFAIRDLAWFVLGIFPLSSPSSPGC